MFEVDENIEVKIEFTPTAEERAEIDNCQRRMEILEKRLKKCPAWRSKEREDIQERLRYESKTMAMLLSKLSSGSKIQYRAAEDCDE